MQRIVFFIGMIVKASAFTMTVNQQEKQATLTLTRGEMEFIYSVLDDAPLAGGIRKPLLQKIEAAYKKGFMSTPQIKSDSTKPQRP